MTFQIIRSLIYIMLALSWQSVIAADALRHNPFEKPEMMQPRQQANVTQVGELKLRGTVIDGVNSLVNINGKFYRFNQEIAGYRIVRIARDSVTLRRGTSDTVLLLNDKK